MAWKCVFKNEISADTKIMDTRVKPEHDEQRDSFLGNGPRMTKEVNIFLGNNPRMTKKDDIFSGNGPRMTNGRMDTRVKPEYDKKKTSSLYQKEENTSHTSSSDLTQENVHPLSSLCMRKENTLNFSPLDTEQENSSASSSSDLIRRSTESKNDIDMDIIPNGCPIRSGMTRKEVLSFDKYNTYLSMRGRNITKDKNARLSLSSNLYPLSSSDTGQRNNSHLSYSNHSPLSSSDLIGGSIKDEGAINNLSQTKKSDIPSNNLSKEQKHDAHSAILSHKNKHNSNNSSQRKGYTMNPTILPQQKEYNSLSNNLPKKKGCDMNLNILPQQNNFNTNPNNLLQPKGCNTNNLLQLKEHDDLPKKKGCDMKQNHEMGRIPSLSSSCVTRGSIGQQCRLSQSGRSMVEMLGTLAIIGVLSVGGIMGYSYGMDKWRASATLNDVNLRMIDLVTQVLQGRSDIALSNEWATTGQAGYPIGLFPNIDNEPSIIVEQVPSSVCKLLLSGSSDTQDIFVGLKSSDQIDGNWYSGSNEDICEGGNKDMLFALNEEVLANLPKDDSGSEGDTTTECKTNADCHTDKPFCEGGICKTCAADEHCPSELKYCDTAKGVCHECISNDDCGAGQFCADTNESSTKANPYTCKNLSFSTIDLTNEEGVTETWHYSNEPMTWWDTKMACDAMDLRMPTFLELSTGERSSTTLMGYYVVRPHIYTLFNLTSAYSANPWSSFLTVDTPHKIVFLRDGYYPNTCKKNEPICNGCSVSGICKK